MDLSYILNSPDVERVATALETIADKTVETMNGKLDKQQGAANAGKALVVGEDGNIWFGNAGIPDSVKTALLNLVQHVAYTDDQGQSYYGALYAALYNEEPPVPPTPTDVIPDLTTITPVKGLYYDNSGDEATMDDQYIAREYLDVLPSSTYIWTQGFGRIIQYEQNGEKKKLIFQGRVCFYRSDKSFISRAAKALTAVGDNEPRSMSFTTPEDAAFIRVSWGNNSEPGTIGRAVSDELYAVFVNLANKNDATISTPNDFAADNFTILRDGTDTGIDINWQKCVFTAADQYTPENPDKVSFSNTRISNMLSILLKRGDVLRFSSSVKYCVYCEKISTGVSDTTDGWVTDGSDYMIGGGENG